MTIRKPRWLALVAGGATLLVVGAWLAAYMAPEGFLRGPVVGSSAAVAVDGPAAGQIWFGRDFDPRTLDVAGRTTTVKTGTSLAAVARLTTAIGDGQAFWRLLRNDQLLENGLLRLSGTGDVLGTMVSRIEGEGRYEYDIVDLGGNVLASGSFVVRNQ